MKDYLILIVLYKKKAADSETIKSVKAGAAYLRNSELFVWDNSPISYVSDADLRYLDHSFSKIHFRHEPRNWPLSKIYNYIIDSFSASCHYLIILDHDTLLTEEYFSEISRNIDGYPKVDLFLPRIFFNDKMVSPGKLYFFIGRYIKKETGGLIRSKFITAINSGMVIRSEYFLKYSFRYDEYLKYYGTDDFFMKSYANNCDSIVVLNCRLEHSLGLYDKNEDIELKSRRFKEIMRSVKYLNRDNKLLEIITSSYIFLKSLLMALKYRSLKFIR